MSQDAVRASWKDFEIATDNILVFKVSIVKTLIGVALGLRWDYVGIALGLRQDCKGLLRDCLGIAYGLSKNW